MQKKEVLLIEDNAGDQRLTLEAIRDRGDHSSVQVVSDGVEAMAYLRKLGKFQQVSSPSLIILDLGLPGKDGREVLEEIKKDPLLMRIPVIVISGSQDNEDILTSYRLHANCFIHKPSDLEEYFAVIESIRDFWLDTVELPRTPN